MPYLTHLLLSVLCFRICATGRADDSFETFTIASLASSHPFLMDEKSVLQGDLKLSSKQDQR
jgi:hypothetical protein